MVYPPRLEDEEEGEDDGENAAGSVEVEGGCQPVVGRRPAAEARPRGLADEHEGLEVAHDAATLLGP